MPGLMVATAIFGLMVALNKTTASAFLIASHFLYLWYWIWAIIQGICFLIPSLLITGMFSFGGLLAGHEVKPKIGGLMGLIIGMFFGGSLSLFAFGAFIIKRAMLIIGAYLLMTSGKSEIAFSEFNKERMLTGVIILLLSNFMLKLSAKK